MRYVIIGVGPAGITAAQTILKTDKDAEITMISTDEFVHSRCMLHRYLSHERNEETLSFIDKDFFTANNIHWVKGVTVEKIDVDVKKVCLSNQEDYLFDKLLIATGANSFIPPIAQFREAKNVFGLRHLSDAQQIRPLADLANHILIVGSGLVGMDAAYAFLEQGKKVTVIEMADRILPIQLNETAGKPYQKLFEEHGCKFIFGKKACDTHMNSNGYIDAVILDDGTKINCDLIVLATGVRPAVACAENSKIHIDRFIQVDDTMKTNCDDIYSAGDVTGLSGIWPNAMKQGQVAGLNMCGIETHYTDSYAMKNTMNFYGLVTLSLGRGVVEEGDTVLEQEDKGNYKRAIIRNGKLDSILLQGCIDYAGIYQYLIKNEIELSHFTKDSFHLSFADFYGIDEKGKYYYEIK
ncbi:NAD(P)/FAD-dependent oxidoreductase [Faecalimonas sp.]